MPMRKFLVLAVAATAGLLVAAPAMVPATAAVAASHDVLTIRKVGGNNVKKDAILKASLKSGTSATFLTSKNAGVTCKSVSFTDKVLSNPRAKGTAREELTKQTFSKCSVHGITDATGVKSVKLTGLPYKSTISDRKGDPVSVSGTTATITLKSVLGTLTCKYHANTTKGSASNTSQTISFSNQAFKKKAGVSACPGSGHFTATFGPVKDTSVSGDPHVFIN
jgi:hypothetical protein